MVPRSDPRRPPPEEPWWRSAVLYQIYPRSFADADGDGTGDLAGVIAHLDHLAWLGVDGIWLNPIMPSPGADWGYDVSDYTSVDPTFGDLATLDRLVEVAGALDIRVLLDLVPNHTSDRHPWFVQARSSRDADGRERYVWADPGPDGGPPNNWRSTFGGSAWTLDERTGQYYLHNFLAEQPDLNWWDDGVRDGFDDILRFWFDRGIAGFRIDVAHGLVKDRRLRDDPIATAEDDERTRAFGLRQINSMHRDEVHDVYRRWRRIADGYDPPRVLVGETWVDDLARLARFHGDGDELDLTLNVPFVFSSIGPEMRRVVEATQAAFPSTAWPSWTGSNHDVGRLATRWAGGDERKVRAALMILLTLRGTPILYYGDEIGLTDVPVPRERLRDPVGIRGWPDERGRDGARTPMPWTGGTGGGFTSPDVEPWLPLGAPTATVEDQRRDPMSVLHLCRDLIALRRARPDIATGSFEAVQNPGPVWAWRRGGGTLVAVNPSDQTAEITIDATRVLIGSRRERDGARVAGPLWLDAWEAVVLGDGP
jgi:alpha-glucosidase